MKGLLNIIILALITLPLSAKKSSCYESLLNGENDSSYRKIYAPDVDKNFERLSEANALSLVESLYDSLSCYGADQITVYKSKCTYEFSKNFPICRIDTKHGFFILSEDYMQNVHIIFNRWD